MAILTTIFDCILLCLLVAIGPSMERRERIVTLAMIVVVILNIFCMWGMI